MRRLLLVLMSLALAACASVPRPGGTADSASSDSSSAPSPASPAPPETRSLVVHAARSGDVRAFAELVDTYYARCLRFALHMLASRDDAEEAVQDTFIRVYRALRTYEEREAFEPWLFRILANRC